MLLSLESGLPCPAMFCGLDTLQRFKTERADARDRLQTTADDLVAAQAKLAIVTRCQAR